MLSRVSMKITLLFFLAHQLIWPFFADSTKVAVAQTINMTFQFTDECDDGLTPEIDFYLKSNPEKLWGTYWLQYYNKPLKAKITCEEDSQICFGAWLEDSTWGCGKKCSEACKGACFTCKATTISIGLQCNK